MKFLEPDHYGVKLSPDDWERMITWMDTNALFYGTFNPEDQARSFAENKSLGRILNEPAVYDPTLGRSGNSGRCGPKKWAVHTITDCTAEIPRREHFSDCCSGWPIVVDRSAGRCATIAETIDVGALNAATVDDERLAL